MTITPGSYAVLSAVVFAVGVYGVVARRDGTGILIALAVMFLGPVIALVGFSEFGAGGQTPPAGAAFAAVVLASIVAEGAAAGAILSLVRRRREIPDADGSDDLTA